MFKFHLVYIFKNTNIIWHPFPALKGTVQIINDKQPPSDISPEMALRISTVFGGTPDIWLRLQAKYDLQIAAKKVKQMKLTPYKRDEQDRNNLLYPMFALTFIESLKLLLNYFLTEDCNKKRESSPGYSLVYLSLFTMENVFLINDYYFK